MRKFACLAPVLAFAPAVALAACAAAPAVPPPATDGTCNAAGTDSFVGQRRSDATGAAILAATGSRQIRWVTPGMMVTMEFSPSRVTVHVGADGRIERIVCG